MYTERQVYAVALLYLALGIMVSRSIYSRRATDAMEYAKEGWMHALYFSRLSEYYKLPWYRRFTTLPPARDECPTL